MQQRCPINDVKFIPTGGKDAITKPKQLPKEPNCTFIGKPASLKLSDGKFEVT